MTCLVLGRASLVCYCVISLGALVFAPVLRATDLTWTGFGGNDHWNGANAGNDINWTTNGTDHVLWSNYEGANAIFTGTGTVDAAHADAVIVGDITFTSTTGTFVVSGSKTDFTLGGSSASTLDTTKIDTDGVAVTFGSSAILTGASKNLTKDGVGTLTLSGVNTYSGLTTVCAGTLILSTTGTAISSSGFTINNGAMLQLTNTATVDRIGAVTVTMKGGTFHFDHGSNTNAIAETVGSLEIKSGASTIMTDVSASGGSSILTFGGLSRTAGATVNFGGGTGNTSATNDDNNVRITGQAAGLIGAYATVGGTNFANYTTTGTASVGVFTSYDQTLTRLTASKVIANNSTQNGVVTEGTGTLANITLAVTSGSTALNTLTNSSTGGPATVAITSIQRFQVNGILNASGANALNIGNTAGTGTVSAVTSGGELVLHNYSTSTMTVNSVIDDADATHSAHSALTKSGTGNVTLAAGNTFTGNTYVNQGTLTLTGSGAIANSPVITLSGGSTLNVSGVTGGNWSLGSSQTLTGSGAVTGATTIYGTHAAGDAGTPGSQAFSSTLTYGNGSIFSWDLNAGTSDTGANANNSGSYDKITAIGAVTSAATAEFMVNLLGGTAFTNAFWDTNKTWSNIIVGGSGSESLASIFTTFSGADISSSGVVTGQGQFSFSGNNLQWTVVPEPTTAIAGVLLVFGLLRRRR